MNFEVSYTGKWNSAQFTKEQEEYIVDKYLNNKEASTVTIAKEFGVSYPTIKKVLDRNNIELKSLRSYKKQYELNTSFFNKIDSEDKAYWLGFLYADGVIIENENLVRINLATIDKSHLEKFRKSIGSTHPIKNTDKKTKEKIYKLNYISIKCSEMCKDLIKHGCVQNKSMILTFPENIPNELTHHFIRGYFDGDGSISNTQNSTKHSNRKFYKISIIGTENMMQGIVKNIPHNKINIKKPKNKNYYSIEIAGSQKVKEMIEYLYKDSTIFLERKWQKSTECINYIKENPYTAWNKGLKKSQY